MALRAEGKASEAEMLYTEAVEAGLTATKQQIRGDIGVIMCGLLDSLETAGDH